MKIKEIMRRLSAKDMLIIAAVIITALFYFFIAWLWDDSIFAVPSPLHPVYVIFAPLLTIFLVRRLRISLKGKLPCLPEKDSLVETLTTILLILSVFVTIIAVYEIYVGIYYFYFWDPYAFDMLNEKSLIFKKFYNFTDTGCISTLGISIYRLQLSAIFLNGLCWLMCVFFYKPKKIISAVPFFNAGLIIVSLNNIFFIMNLNFADAYGVEKMIYNLQISMYYAILGFVCAIIFDVSGLYTVFADKEQL